MKQAELAEASVGTSNTAAEGTASAGAPDAGAPPIERASAVASRHTPLQARAARRIEAVVDAAAAVIESHGVEHLTTALIAQRAGASIGTVYRYFPDRVSVLAALAARNGERLREAALFALGQEHGNWQDALSAVVAAFEQIYRNEPSFRAIRQGQALDLGPSQPKPKLDQLVTKVREGIADRWGVQLGNELDIAIGSADALIAQAFLYEASGDEQYLQLARQAALAQVGSSDEESRGA